MGDRANLQFKSDEGTIGIYGHWAGTDMAAAAMAVINNPKFQARIGDSSYANRIGVQTALEALGSLSKEETGFGLYVGTNVPDNDGYGIVVIDVETGTVSVDGSPILDPTERKIESAMIK